jgi:hypothetical protein
MVFGNGRDITGDVCRGFAWFRATMHPMDTGFRDAAFHYDID